MQGLSQEKTSGHGHPRIYSHTWLSDVESVGAGTTSDNDPTAPDVDGTLSLSGQANASKNTVHIYAKLTTTGDTPTQPAPNSSTAELDMWFQPEEDDGWYKVDALSVDNKYGNMWSKENMPPGSYVFGITSISADTRVEILFDASN